MKPLIFVQNVSRYFGDLCAVDGLSFELTSGEILGFLGPNGAGKSTTMGMISGNLAASSGHIQIGGIDLHDHPIEAKKKLGYLPEQPPLYLELTVDEYLQFCARLRQISKLNSATALHRVKERCGLTEVGKRLIANLSKGYRQRLGIAQAVLHEPKAILLDEPTSGLDPNQIQEIRNLIKELGTSSGILLSTHILSEVQALCDRVLILHRGQLVYSDTIHTEKESSTREITLQIQKPPPLSQLEALPGVAAVHPISKQRFQLQLTLDAASWKIAEAIAKQHWQLAEFTPKRDNLEQIFTRLTSADQEEPKTQTKESA